MRAINAASARRVKSRLCNSLPPCVDGYKMAMSKDLKNTVTAWLRRVLDATGWDAAELARRSGVSPSTISRALDVDQKHVMGTTAIIRISQASGIPGPGIDTRSAGLAPTAGGLAEPDAEPWRGEPSFPRETGALDHWRIRTRLLEGAGIWPGDLVAVDRSKAPTPQSVVVAQVYDPRGAETVFRVYDPPYLVVRALDPAQMQRPLTKPLLVDQERVLIVGVCVALQRTML